MSCIFYHSIIDLKGVSPCPSCVCLDGGGAALAYWVSLTLVEDSHRSFCQEGAFLRTPCQAALHSTGLLSSGKHSTRTPIRRAFADHSCKPQQLQGHRCWALCFQNCSECKEKRAAHILCTYCNRWLCSSCTEEHRHVPAPGGPLFARAQKGSSGTAPHVSSVLNPQVPRE